MLSTEASADNRYALCSRATGQILVMMVHFRSFLCSAQNLIHNILPEMKCKLPYCEQDAGTPYFHKRNFVSYDKVRA